MKNLERRIRTTRDARFEAYRRMRRRKISSTVSLAMLSLSIIFFNILQLLDDYECFNASITAVTIILSTLVLTMSLLVTSLNYSEREHQYLNCALRLSHLMDYIEELKKSNKDNFEDDSSIYKDVAGRYNSVICECPINHIVKDYKRAVARFYPGKDNAYTPPTDSCGSDIEAPVDPAEVKPETNRCVSRFCKTVRGVWNWIDWNILDVNILYWALTILIPILAWHLIFVWRMEPTPPCA